MRRKRFEARLLVATLGEALSGKGKRDEPRVPAEAMLAMMGGAL